MLIIVLIALFSSISNATQMHIYPESPRSFDPITIQIKGKWINNCSPKNESNTIKDNHIQMYAKVDPKCNINLIHPNPKEYELEFKSKNWIRNIFAIQKKFFYLEYYITTNNFYNQLYAFDIIRMQEPNEPMLSPENGFWWVDVEGEYGSQAKGSGFSIDRQDNHLTVMAQFYDEEGAPVWYYSEGQLNKGIYKAELKKITGGKTLYAHSSRKQNVESAGNLFITFSSQSVGTAWIVSHQNGVNGEIALQPISIRRYQSIKLQGSNLFKGDWIMVAENTHSELPALRVKFGQNVKKSKSNWQFTGIQNQLLCDVIGEQEKQAKSCVLQNHKGEGIAIFDDIGLDKLLGIHINSGQRVQFIKIK